MLKDEPSGLTYSKILSNFRNSHPEKYRKTFIRLALSKQPFKLLRKKYVLGKKIKTRKQKSKTVVSSFTPLPSSSLPLIPPTTLVAGPLATIYDNSSVGIVPTLTLSATNSVAQWQYEHDGWKNYDKVASDVVEAAYQDWQKNPFTDVRAIKSGEWQYTVDFNTMIQENIQHENHTKRNIRRTIVSL